MTNGVKIWIDVSGSSRKCVLKITFRVYVLNTKISKSVIVEDPDPDLSFKLTV